jgi:hypothetical protein
MQSYLISQRRKWSIVYSTTLSLQLLASQSDLCDADAAIVVGDVQVQVVTVRVHGVRAHILVKYFCATMLPRVKNRSASLWLPRASKNSPYSCKQNELSGSASSDRRYIYRWQTNVRQVQQELLCWQLPLRQQL